MLQRYYMAHGVPDPAPAMHRGLITIGDTIRAQAAYLGYADCFGPLGMILLCTVLTVVMLKKGSSTGTQRFGRNSLRPSLTLRSG
jgi:MFS transporter, DHA2 family, multidrug resistance protein